MKRAAAGEVREEVGGRRQDLHQPLRAGRGRARFEFRLGVDHRRDQRRVEVLLGGLFADDARVAERQREVALDVRAAIDSTISAARPARSATIAAIVPSDVCRLILQACQEPPTARARAPPRCRRCCTTNVARRAFSSCESWRAARSSTSACPRAAARWRAHRLLGDDRDRRVIELAPGRPRTAAAPRRPPRAAAGCSARARCSSQRRDARADQRPQQALQPGAVLLASRTPARATAARSTTPPGATSAPKRATTASRSCSPS